MITIDVLKTFVAVVDCGTVVGAARDRGYSPAAVSRQMGWLQRRLGVTFFVPEGRSIRPTEAALEYAERAREFVDEVNRFERYSSSFGRSVTHAGKAGLPEAGMEDAALSHLPHT